MNDVVIGNRGGDDILKVIALYKTACIHREGLRAAVVYGGVVVGSAPYHRINREFRGRNIIGEVIALRYGVIAVSAFYGDVVTIVCGEFCPFAAIYRCAGRFGIPFVRHLGNGEADFIGVVSTIHITADFRPCEQRRQRILRIYIIFSAIGDYNMPCRIGFEIRGCRDGDFPFLHFNRAAAGYAAEVVVACGKAAANGESTCGDGDRFARAGARSIVRGKAAAGDVGCRQAAGDSALVGQFYAYILIIVGSGVAIGDFKSAYRPSTRNFKGRDGISKCLGFCALSVEDILRAIACSALQGYGEGISSATSVGIGFTRGIAIGIGDGVLPFAQRQIAAVKVKAHLRRERIAVIYFGVRDKACRYHRIRVVRGKGQVFAAYVHRGRFGNIDHLVAAVVGGRYGRGCAIQLQLSNAVPIACASHQGEIFARAVAGHKVCLYGGAVYAGYGFGDILNIGRIGNGRIAIPIESMCFYLLSAGVVYSAAAVIHQSAIILHLSGIVIVVVYKQAIASAVVARCCALVIGKLRVKVIYQAVYIINSSSGIGYTLMLNNTYCRIVWRLVVSTRLRSECAVTSYYNIIKGCTIRRGIRSLRYRRLTYKC